MSKRGAPFQNSLKMSRSAVITRRKANHFFRRTRHSEDEDEQACGEELPYEKNSSKHNVAHVSKIITKISLERNQSEHDSMQG